MAVAVQVQYILAVAGAQRVKIPFERRASRMVTGGIGGTMAESHDKSYGGVSLGRIHQHSGLAIPVRPGTREGLRICNEADIAIVEPVPVLANTTLGCRRAGVF